tara:strand:+ start:3028 stop:3696 length:669 start_codon:yes stop_codon:yes gene_type:complete
MNKKKLFKLQINLKTKFKSIDLLKRSLTHKSYDNINNYEKLEFLGDRVLGLTISKKLLELYPNDNEGILDKKLASLVNKKKCFEIGKNLKLHEYILVGNSNKRITKIEEKIVSDCCEAIIGAVYLDKGFEYTEKFVLNIWNDLIKHSKITLVDAKTKLQEFSLKKYKTLPVYKVISNTGPRHKPNFKVAVKLKELKYISASGSSKKQAEQEAAKEYLKFLNL